jgi:hypothetical protein
MAVATLTRRAAAGAWPTAGCGRITDAQFRVLRACLMRGIIHIPSPTAAKTPLNVSSVTSSES